MRRPLTHPKFTPTLAPHFPSTCNIVWVTTNLEESGQNVPDGSVEVIEGLADIPCRLGPMGSVTGGGHSDMERRSEDITALYKRRVCMLNGYYAGIVPRLQQAQVDGTLWDIAGVESDSQKINVKLRLEQVSP